MAKSKEKIFSHSDPFLEAAVNELIQKYKCHTVVLYGSRARGDETPKSDYDLMGVRKSGKKFRFAEKRDGKYLDVFIYLEKDLKKVDESHLYMKHAIVLFERNNYGTQFLKKLGQALKKKYKPLPADELQTKKVWAYKMLERIEVGDIEAKYRRSWLHEALLYDYFYLRKERFWGSKQSFDWLKKNDSDTYTLFGQVLDNPQDLKVLRQLVDRVTDV